MSRPERGSRHTRSGGPVQFCEFFARPGGDRRAPEEQTCVGTGGRFRRRARQKQKGRTHHRRHRIQSAGKRNQNCMAELKRFARNPLRRRKAGSSQSKAIFWRYTSIALDLREKIDASCSIGIGLLPNGIRVRLARPCQWTCQERPE